MTSEANPDKEPSMTDYDIFARYYDAVMGDRSKAAAKVEALIKEKHPAAKTILELGAGTGTNLVPLAGEYEVSGLDLSEAMLEVAKKKLPEAKFYNQNMVSFELDKKFDVIICLFDSVNHLLDWEEWQQMFRNVQQHLSESGVFIFDVNTPEKLQRLVTEQPNIQEFDGGLMVMKVEDAGNGMINWHEKFFVRQEDTQYKLYEENIKETAFPVEQIQRELETTFSGVEVQPDPASKGRGIVERIYFSCKK